MDTTKEIVKIFNYWEKIYGCDHCPWWFHKRCLPAAVLAIVETEGRDLKDVDVDCDYCSYWEDELTLNFDELTSMNIRRRTYFELRWTYFDEHKKMNLLWTSMNLLWGKLTMNNNND